MRKRKSQSLLDVINEGDELVRKTLAHIQANRPILDPSSKLNERLAALPFWCGDLTLHKNKDYQEKFCCLTHVVGLPIHPSTKKPMPLTDYQIEVFNRLQKEKKPKKGQSKDQADRTPHKFHINKGRQMGFTELTLRIIQYGALHDYAGSNIGIVAGTNGRLAQKDLRRLARLYQSIPGVVDQWVKNNTLKLTNGTVIEAFKASEESMTGDTNYKCIFMDEAAKWRLVDDTSVFNSIEPIVEAAGGDLLLVSTPKGPVKTFYQIHKQGKGYYKMNYDIWHTKGNMYTKHDIDRMIANSEGDPNQEYLCKFRFGKDSTLGEVIDREKIDLTAWGVDPEGDDYDEPEDFDKDKFKYKDEDGFNPDEVWRPDG